MIPLQSGSCKNPYETESIYSELEIKICFLSTTCIRMFVTSPNNELYSSVLLPVTEVKLT